MKSISAAREAATTKKSSPKATGRYVASVNIKTAKSIAEIAEEFGLPPALVAGTMAHVGCALIEGAGEIIGVSSIQSAKELIFGNAERITSSVPVLLTEYARETTDAWSEKICHPLDSLVGKLIEMGIRHYAKHDVLSMCGFTSSCGVLYSVAHCIREDNDDPEAAALLKPLPKSPPAFVAFEKILAAKGGAA